MRYRKVKITAYVEPYIAGGIRDIAAEMGVSRSTVTAAMLEAADWAAAKEIIEEAQNDRSGADR